MNIKQSYMLTMIWQLDLAYADNHIEIVKWLIDDHQVDAYAKRERVFRSACSRGHIKIAKWLVRDFRVDTNTENEYAFRMACDGGHIKIAKWLVNNHRVDVHAKNEYAFRKACKQGHMEIAKWFIEEFRHTDNPYYYHKNTAYILNHQPIDEWQSCNILGCPIIYNGELDEEAVIIFMATLKQPKSARS
jgi:hypothetical protein